MRLLMLLLLMLPIKILQVVVLTVEAIAPTFYRNVYLLVVGHNSFIKQVQQQRGGMVNLVTLRVIKVDFRAFGPQQVKWVFT